MKKARPPSDLQLAVLRVLWAREEATVAEVREALAPERGLALTTVATVLARLARRGLVQRRTEGRQHVYRAAVEEREVRRSMLTHLLDHLFEGDPAALVHHLVREGEIDARDLARLRRILAPRDGTRGEAGGR